MAVTEYIPILSSKEKNRRWNLIREKLIEEHLDAALIYGHTLQQLGGNFHYLTQIWGKDGGSMLIFPVEGEPHMVLPAYGGAARISSSWVLPENVRTTVNFSYDVADEVIAMGLSHSRIGVDNFVTWPARDYMVFSSLCPDTDLIDMYVPFARIRGQKSDEELAYIIKEIQIAELSHKAFFDNLKPGRDCTKVVAAAESVLIENEISRDRVILTHADPQMVYPYTPRREKLNVANPVTFSTEFTSVHGGGCQVVRTYSWEEPKGDTKRIFELIGKIREAVPSLFIPGKSLTQAGAEIIKMVEDYGFSCDKLGHACGVTYAEIPFITGGPGQLDYMEWTIQENEVYVVHPMIRSKDGTPPFGWMGDIYHVGKEETVWLSTFMPELPIMIP